MTQLARWNPFKTLSRIDPSMDFEDMFRNVGMRPFWREMEPTPDMRMDVIEEDKSYRVNAEIPGVKKEDIEVSVEGNRVTISAEVKRETEKKGESEVCQERYYGKVLRGFALPAEVDSTKVEAHYDNGVLSLTLPKKGNGHGRRIAVS
ncbi:MAG: Hsp20/alpha crystallin family protein [Mizugakiibacter sp.]|uniref:Hsp20/alpha crystallin family protein n=1 Tax=Mizugakiibacter sp. TaxID=1972610 RepID=UPI0031C580B2|nr:Hsp20/alpha crystallin family protein [Xanthomonadaceae bacterium]